MLEPDTPIPEFYDLLQRAYTYLENNDPTLRAVLHFEQELARLHGIAHPGIPAHVILKSHFGKLPSQREKLLGSLEQKKVEQHACPASILSRGCSLPCSTRLSSGTECALFRARD